MRSMTGYGSAKGECAGTMMRLELKSVNNRYLDCSVRLPRNLLYAEEPIKSRVQQHISRGKVDVFVTAESAASDDMVVKINEALAERYAGAISLLAEKLRLNSDLTAYALSRLPEVLTLEKKDVDPEQMTQALTELTEQALRDFDGMRLREGARLREDVSGRLDTVETLVGEIEQRSPETVKLYQERLYQKMCEVLQNSAVDAQRILLEAGIFADKVAVDEETVRLRSHVSQMRHMLESEIPIGRKMDFLLQEFNREANTIGSKCSDSTITKTVIDLKSEIEKIREQIQNIE